MSLSLTNIVVGFMTFALISIVLAFIAYIIYILDKKGLTWILFIVPFLLLFVFILNAFGFLVLEVF